VPAYFAGLHVVPKLVHDDEDAKDCRDHFALLSLLRRMFDGTEQQVLAQGSRQIPMLPCCSSFSLGLAYAGSLSGAPSAAGQ
jgi:hypothetical protein